MESYNSLFHGLYSLQEELAIRASYWNSKTQNKKRSNLVRPREKFNLCSILYRWFIYIFWKFTCIPRNHLLNMTQMGLRFGYVLRIYELRNLLRCEMTFSTTFSTSPCAGFELTTWVYMYNNTTSHYMLSSWNRNSIAQNLFKVRYLLEVNWHLKMFLKLIYTYGLLETDIWLRFLQPSPQLEIERAQYCFFLGKL